MGSITLPGAGGPGHAVTISGVSGDNLFIAQIIRNSIYAASVAAGNQGQFANATVEGGGQISVPAAPTGSGPVILVVPSNASGDINVPSGYGYVYDESPNAVTITAAANVEIISADTSGGAYQLSGQTSLTAGSGNNNVSVTGTYNVAIAGTGTNSITATGHGTLSGGTGSNTFIVTDTASSGTLVLSNGTDSVLAGGDQVSVNASGSHATLNAGTANGVYVQVEGGTTGDQVLGGTGTTDVSTGGAQSQVFGGSGTLSVQDSGLSDTIAAFGASAASIQAWGKDAMIFAGSNATGTAITVSGGGDTQQGGNLVIGGSGSGTTNVLFGPVVTHYSTVIGGTPSVVGGVATVVGGTDSVVSVQEYSAHNTLVGGSGALNVTDEGFADVIAPFGAPATVNAFGQSALILGGSNTLVASIGGGTSDTNDTLVAGSGNAFIQDSGINALILGNTGDLAVSLTGGNAGATIAGFSAAVTDVSVLDVGSGGALIFGGTNNFNVDAAAGSNTVIAGAGAASISLGVGGSDNLVFGGSGSLSVQSGARGDTVAAFGASAANISVTGGLNLVFGGSNTANVSLAGGNRSFDTVIGGSGTTNVTISGSGSNSNNVVYGGAGALNVDDLGLDDVIAGFGASSVSATLAGSNGMYFGGSNSGSVTDAGTADSIVGGSGALTVNAASGSSSLVVYGGSGQLDFVGGSHGSTIIGGPGAATVTAGAGGTTLFGGGGGGIFTFNSTSASGSLNFAAGSGNETLNASGSNTNDFIAAGADSTGANSLVGGSGNDTFTAGAGSDTFVAGPGSNQFVFFASQTNGAHDYINGWTTNDSLFLIGYDSTGSANSLMNAATVGGSSLTVALSDGTQITFNDVTDKAEFNGKILYG